MALIMVTSLALNKVGFFKKYSPCLMPLPAEHGSECLNSAEEVVDFKLAAHENSMI